MTSEPKILIAVASYGHANHGYLCRLLAEFRSMNLRLDLHILSNVPKDLGTGVTVHVGLPTRNPRSLPFAHRQLFAERIEEADYFIYCEDDTLISERNIRAFIEVSAVLKEDEIAGFLRTENLTAKETYVESAHGPYRWEPSTLVRRGDFLLASFSNAHSAFTMASREQLRRAIESGGFLVKPHVGRFGMLECGASDLYTQCGLTRLVCLSRIDDFLVPHLSNKNCPNWGLQYEEFLMQTRAFERIGLNNDWKGSLFEVQTRMSRGRWSKNLYERPDPSVLSRIPADAKKVLSIGCGWGATEQFLANDGKRVVALPVDAVFADCLRRRGVEVQEGSFPEALGRLNGRQFDTILLLDTLHLLPDPLQWLAQLKPLLSPTGVVVASVPRTFDPLRVIWYFRGEPGTAFPGKFANSRVQKVTRSRLKRWFEAVGMAVQITELCNAPARVQLRQKIRGWAEHSLTDRFVAVAGSKPTKDSNTTAAVTGSAVPCVIGRH